jgi:hypothetical protein
VSAYLDERYFDWLYAQVCSVRVRNPSKTYRQLLDLLYSKEFLWMVPNDDNREEDGKDLRFEFLEEEGIDVSERDTLWLELPCSVLEFLVALARLFAFEYEGEVSERFWELLGNLELDQYNDRAEIDREAIEAVLDRLIWRKYHYNGGGGLFPLRYPERDQRWVEVWYQLNAYILERL